MPKYTVEPGRQIYRNGRPFISINREGETEPAEADKMARQLCAMLVSRDERNESRRATRYANKLARSKSARWAAK